MEQIKEPRVVEKQSVDEKGNLLFDKEGKPILSETTDDRADAYVFAYTPQFGLLYDLPLIGLFMSWFFRREFLFIVYKNQLESQYMVGDVVVRGVATKFVGLAEFVADWTTEASIDTEMAILNEEVERLTLTDNLAMLPTRIRNAIDSSSSHQRFLDARDELIGGAVR
jgi:hypothetical protein